MRTNVMDTGYKLLGCVYEELAALNLEWGGYLPLVHPVSLRVITIVHRSCTLEPDPWIRADIRNGKLVNIEGATAQDVAVFSRAMQGSKAK